MKRKQLVYRYDGDSNTDEVEVDHYGEIPVPNQSDVLTRNGKQWKVVHVITEVSTDRDQYPVVRIFLGSMQ